MRALNIVILSSSRWRKRQGRKCRKRFRPCQLHSKLTENRYGLSAE
ncbi:hypothetical protein JCM19237_3214 [Photobacterium aphoticum]|uniref:Uncharacterized protein n=1 Tax=Photobacterium aphoticum TaxID=754436 RepID=A0A090QVP0_9GAMM|nr:hypothetical protein JCM19237_3214 [Photobacterium aphoticum]